MQTTLWWVTLIGAGANILLIPIGGVVNFVCAVFGIVVCFIIYNRNQGEMKLRYQQVKMLHVSLGSHFWHWRDIVFVLTGRV